MLESDTGELLFHRFKYPFIRAGATPATNDTASIIYLVASIAAADEAADYWDGEVTPRFMR